MLAIAIAGSLRAAEIKGLVIDDAGRALLLQGMQAEQTSKNTARIFSGGQEEMATVACVCKGTSSGCSLDLALSLTYRTAQLYIILLAWDERL